ncbi:MAG: DUF3618 domain-containing protein, partial [Solirubrobacterales bacterium]|nr:DUF3618 domain-containing protein [Solirubrobacterales bacterium]
MDQGSRQAGPAIADMRDPEIIKQEIEQTRHELGELVE